MTKVSQINVLDDFRRSFLSTTAFVQRAYRAVERLDGDAFRMRSGDGTKALVEEVMPVAALMKHLETPSRRVRCRLAPENASHDAQLRMSGTEVEHGYFKSAYHLEVTCATAPTDFLTREALTRNGYVYGGGDIRREGSRKKGNDRVVSKATAVSGTAAVGNLVSWIADRIAAKSAKPYPQPCILVIGVSPERNFTARDWADLVDSIPADSDHLTFEFRYIVDWGTNNVFAI